MRLQKEMSKGVELFKERLSTLQTSAMFFIVL